MARSTFASQLGIKLTIVWVGCFQGRDLDHNYDMRTFEISPDLLVRVLVELVANYWSWPGGGGTTPQPQN